MNPIYIPEIWLPIAALFVPVLAAFVSAPTAGNWKRAAVSVVAAGALAVLEELAAGESFALEGFVAAWFTASIAWVTAYVGVWQHASINDKAAPAFQLVR